MSTTDPARPSRRAMFALAAGAAAIPALPAVAMPAPVPVASTEPTPISKLWAERNRIVRASRRVVKARRKLDERFAAEMPKPDPSIVYSPDNDADGLRYYGADKGYEPHSFNSYICSDEITRAIAKLYEERMVTDESGGELVIFVNRKEAPKLDHALVGRLNARLELSVEYENLIERTRDRLGLPTIEEKEQELSDLQSDLEARILRTPAQTAGDLHIKLVLTEHHRSGDDCWHIGHVLRDFRRVVKDNPALQLAGA